MGAMVIGEEPRTDMSGLGNAARDEFENRKRGRVEAFALTTGGPASWDEMVRAAAMV